MSTQAVIAYPSSFLERPEDRSFLIELNHAEVPRDKARLILYRIWADFGTGGSDRRPVNDQDLANDRHVRVLENFCEWSGAPGDLVRLALTSGFLTMDQGGESTFLVCFGFYPINSAWSAKGRGFQKLGGLSRVLKFSSVKASEDVTELEKLWERTSNPFPDIAPETLRRATLFIFQVTRTLGFRSPSDTELRSGTMALAIGCVQNTSEERIRKTLLYLLSLRKDPNLPDRLDAILRTWDSYVEKGIAEMD